MTDQKPRRRRCILLVMSLLAICQAIPLISAADISTEYNSSVTERSVNDGNLILQDVPEIPHSIVTELTRFQNVRYGRFLDWTVDGESIYIRTRFSDTPQIHKVESPNGARKQMTFFREPIGSANRQPTRLSIRWMRGAANMHRSSCSTQKPPTQQCCRMVSRSIVVLCGTQLVSTSLFAVLAETANRTTCG